MKKLFNHYKGLVAIAILATQVISCKEDDATPEVIASFTYEVDAADFKTVNFSNFSTNFTSLSWDFGDGSAASTEENPSHTYDVVGTYTVTLTATGAGGSDEKSQEVVIADPDELLSALAGTDSKTWKLLRDPSTGRYPLLVGPLVDGTTPNGEWWGMGRDNDEIAVRSCMLLHEYTFTRNGLGFERNLNGSMWGEGWSTGGQFPIEGECFATTPENMVDKDDGADLSVWGDFTGTFVLTAGSPNKLKIDGLGAYIGIEKVGTSAEVTEPQSSVTYNIVKLYDGTVDSLIVSAHYKDNDSDPVPTAYWQFVLVHYDNPGDEPPILGPKPIAGFTAVLAGNQLTTTNTTTGAVSYLWDFGDGTTSTEVSPVHTYADDGIFSVRVTATNASGDNSSGYQLFIVNGSTPALTDALLQGGAWKVSSDGLTLFVGPALGSYEWYVVPEADLAPGGSWECLTNDEFTFSTGGVYGYDTNGDVRNDGYMAGFSNGCITDAQLATVTNDGAKFKTEANHSYTFVAAGAGNATITVANTVSGSGAVAFLGFYKAYYGGENNNTANPAQGGATTVKYEVLAYAKSATKEYLFVTCDISAAKDGTASWSFILVR